MVGLFTFSWFACVRKQLYTIPELTNPEWIGDLLPVLQQIKKQVKWVSGSWDYTHVASSHHQNTGLEFFLPDSRQGYYRLPTVGGINGQKEAVTIWWAISKGDLIFYCLCYSSVLNIFLVKMINFSFLVSIGRYD